MHEKMEGCGQNIGGTEVVEPLATDQLQMVIWGFYDLVKTTSVKIVDQ